MAVVRKKTLLNGWQIQLIKRKGRMIVWTTVECGPLSFASAVEEGRTLFVCVGLDMAMFSH
jgi:hypothetical protein